MQSKLGRLSALETPLTLGSAAIATALTFSGVWFFAPHDSYLYAMLLDRGWIQYASTACFWITVAVLAAKHVASYGELAALRTAQEIIANLGSESSYIWSDAQRIRAKFSDSAHERHRASAVFNRVLNALDRLRKSQRTAAVEEYFRTRSDRDASTLETSYAGIRYFVWLLPTLGLIGTVLGLGTGMSRFGDIIRHADDFQTIKGALPEVTNNLGTAFDATFLAIFWSAVASCYMSLLQKRQEHILEQIDSLCMDEVCALFQEHSTASAEIVHAIAHQIELMIKVSNGNRAQIERDLEQLPEQLSQRFHAYGVSVAEHLATIARTSTQLAAGQERLIEKLSAELKDARGIASARAVSERA